MEKDNAIVMEQTHPEIFSAPHIAQNLLQLVQGEWYPNPREMDQLIDHLFRCHYCRSALKVLLAVEPAETRLKGDPETVADEILLRFVTILDEIEAREYEYLSSFAEAVANEGREKAEERFPTLAAHLKSCSICESALNDILTFLDETKGG